MHTLKDPQRTAIFLPLLLSLLIAAPAARAETGALQPTLLSMDFYGSITQAQPGDQVTVVDANGILCGQFTIGQPGRYGFLHVYGDDRATAVDEGAVANERLTFQLNGAPLQPLPDQDVRWLGDGQKQRVDFTVR